jgi:hypothetical protein
VGFAPQTAFTQPQGLPRYPAHMARRRRHHANQSLGYGEIVVFALFAFGATWWAVPKVQLLMMSPEERAAIENSVTYSGCNEVRALGKDPIHMGEPGYRATMDGDGDGVACE